MAAFIKKIINVIIDCCLPTRSSVEEDNPYYSLADKELFAGDVRKVAVHGPAKMHQIMCIDRKEFKTSSA